MRHCFKDNTTKTAEKSNQINRKLHLSHLILHQKPKRRPMEPSSLNGFGSETYWNRPTSRIRSNRPSRSLSPSNRASNTRSNSIVRNLNPTISLPMATVPLSSTSSTTNDDVKVQAQQAQPSTYLQRSPARCLSYFAS